MKLFLKLLIISILLFSCKKPDNKKTIVKSTFKSELTKAITNSFWVYLDFENNLSSIITFISKDRFEFSSFEGVDGPEVINFKGSWHIENDYISIKHDNLDS